MSGQDDAADAAMMELFKAELDSHLPVLSEGLLALEKNSDQPKWFEAMMRAAHSIKGAARIVGVEDAVRVARVLEDCFVAAQKGAVHLGPGAIDVLLRGVDVLGHIGQPSAAPVAVEALNGVVAAIAAIRQGPRQAMVASAPTYRLPDLDAAGTAELRRQLSERRRGGARTYRLDFADVRDIDPLGLAVLALFARLPCGDGSTPRLEVTGANAEVGRILRLTGLDAFWAVLPEPEG